MSCGNIKLIIDSHSLGSNPVIKENIIEEDINYDHIFIKYYWTIVVLVAINILLFFLILVLLYILK
jgi:hypothetical protein